MSELIDQLRKFVLNDRILLTHHAAEEAAKDRLLAVDVESALLTGGVARIQPSEPENPGPRYTVHGQATDLHTPVGVVCRFVHQCGETYLLIVTCYEIKPDDQSISDT